jgi:hypothetical protein
VAGLVGQILELECAHGRKGGARSTVGCSHSSTARSARRSGQRKPR